MATCSRCGKEIEFRYIDGRCIPLHLNGGCNDSDGAIVKDYAGRNSSNESACFSTRCPTCEQVVFFIRHNGGSVWIDAPLGPPWYKHPCFDEDQVKGERRSLFDEYKQSFDNILPEKSYGNDGSIVIGVVTTTSVNLEKTITNIVMSSGSSTHYKIRTKFNAGFLLSKLCVYDANKGYIWPIENSDYRFTVTNIVVDEKIKCPECELLLWPKKLKKHMKKEHGHG